MGLKDAAEMLEVAKAENVKLERALLRIKKAAERMQADPPGYLYAPWVLEIVKQAGL
jgi:hypothetical protein